MRSTNLFTMSTLSAALLLLSGQVFAEDEHHIMSMSAPDIQTSENHSSDHAQHQKTTPAPKTVAEEKKPQTVPLTADRCQLR